MKKIKQSALARAAGAGGEGRGTLGGIGRVHDNEGRGTLGGIGVHDNEGRGTLGGIG